MKRAFAGVAMVLVMAASAEAQTRRATIHASAEILAPIVVTPHATMAEPVAGGALRVTAELGIGAPVPHAVHAVVQGGGPEAHRSVVTERTQWTYASSPPSGAALESSGSIPVQGVERHAFTLSAEETEHRVTLVIAAVL